MLHFENERFTLTKKFDMKTKLDNTENPQHDAKLPVMSGFYTDGIDHSNLEVNSHEYPEYEECVFCGSTSVTITDYKDICHDCGYVYE